MSEELERAERYRSLAKTLRNISDDPRYPQWREAILRVAQDYDNVAEAIEAMCGPGALPVSSAAIREPPDDELIALDMRDEG
jgi:hypothetical protein